MDKFAFPRQLFPSVEQIQQWSLVSSKSSRSSNLGSMNPFLHSVRSRAVQTAFHAVPDKELERFMHPVCRWDNGIRHQLEIPPESSPAPYSVQELGNGAWLADFEVMPFHPEELSFSEDLFSQSFSIVHYGLATFSRFRVLYVPPGVVLEDRVTVYTEHASLSYDAHILYCIVGKGARVSLECLTSVERGIFTHVLLGWCAERSSVALVQRASYGSHALGLMHELWHNEKESSLESVSSATGGAQLWGKKEYTVGEAASVSHVSLSAVGGVEQEALITSQIHQGKDSSSSVLVKSALCDASRSFYRGTIVLEETAQRAQAHQQQRALMLSTQARMCALPSLEVAAFNVRCSHGSAAGGFNNEQVEYLRTRGISSEQAHTLLIEGFFNDGITLRSDALRPLVQYLKGRCRPSLSQPLI